MIRTDILIIGAGPVGLFAVFEAGLLKLHCHLIDSLPQVGGQLAEIYPKKPIYDIPGFPEVLAGDLIRQQMEQIAPFKPGFTLAEVAETIESIWVEEEYQGEKRTIEKFIVTTNKGTQHEAYIVAIAGGLGVFEPRKPPIPDISFFEGKGVEYMIKQPEDYIGQRLVIAGGGDSALDWSIYFAQKDLAKVTLVHRSSSFRGHLDSVQKVIDLAEQGKINLITQAEVVGVQGEEYLQSVTIAHETGENTAIACDFFIPLFGLSPKLGPIANWGLNLEKNAIKVDFPYYQTNRQGIFAIGDVNTYPGKLKLILCGYHEATLMCQAAFAKIHPQKKNDQS